MKFSRVYIESFAYKDPDVFLSSEELEQKLAALYNRLKLPFGRLELSTGIKERGYFENLRPSEISSAAAKNLFARSKTRPEEVELLIHSSVCRDFLEPSTASGVHRQLGLSPNCASFDLSNACLGFLDAMNLAASQIEAGQINNALIVTGENSRPLIENSIDFLNNNLELTRKSVKKYFANLTIGSAGVAFLLTGNKDHALAEIAGSTGMSDTSAAALCQGDGDLNALMMETESEELLLAGVELAKKCFENFKREVFPTPNRIIGHQVGAAHRNLLMDSLKLDKGSDYTTYQRYGNTGSAACPLTLVKAWEAGMLQSGDEAAMLGIGSGLHTRMTGLRWA